MAEKKIKSRIVHKHDTAANWAKATNFIPKQGEIIVYDKDSNNEFPRIKIGDGATNVNSLPFADDKKLDKTTFQQLVGNTSVQQQINDAMANGGMGFTEITKAEYEQLKASGQLNENVYYNIIDDFDVTTVINDDSVETIQTYSSQKIEDSFSKKSLVVDTILTAANWINDTAPFSLTLFIDGITDLNINEIFCSKTCTDEQLKAYQSCGLKDGGQSNGQITLLAMKKKPIIDIPVTIIVRKDI